MATLSAVFFLIFQWFPVLDLRSEPSFELSDAQHSLASCLQMASLRLDLASLVLETSQHHSKTTKNALKDHKE